MPPAKIDFVVRARRVRRLGPVPLLLALAVAVLGAVPAFAQPPDFAAVDDAARDAVQSGDIPGVVVLVGRGDDVLLLRSYGWRRLIPDPAPMTTDTIFDIASLTKPFGTTLAVMSLVERGSVKLDAPLGRYLAEFRKPVFAQVTIQRLLTHSAGFPAIPPPGAVKASASETIKAFSRLPFDYHPGSGTQYSDIGFILLGEVVRRVSGQPLDRYLERAVYKPLRLQRHDVHARPPSCAPASPPPSGPMATCSSAKSTTRGRGRWEASPGTPGCSRRRATSRGSAACSWMAGRWTAARCSSRPPSR